MVGYRGREGNGQTAGHLNSQFSIANRQAAAASLTHISRLTALLGVEIAERDQELARVQERYAKRIEALRDDIEGRERELRAWSVENRKPEFGEAKSLELPSGWLRFRLGNPRLELRRGWDWDRVLGRLLKFPVTSQWAQYVRRDPSLDLQLILRDAKGEHPLMTDRRLMTIGLRLGQGERFVVEPKPENTVAALLA